jgi:hypothetical protein
MPNDLGVQTAPRQLTEALRWPDGEIETHLHDVLEVRLAALPPEAKLRPVRGLRLTG